jgi:hypothetical protein
LGFVGGEADLLVEVDGAGVALPGADADLFYFLGLYDSLDGGGEELATEALALVGWEEAEGFDFALVVSQISEPGKAGNVIVVLEKEELGGVDEFHDDFPFFGVGLVPGELFEDGVVGGEEVLDGRFLFEGDQFEAGGQVGFYGGWSGQNELLFGVFDEEALAGQELGSGGVEAGDGVGEFETAVLFEVGDDMLEEEPAEALALLLGVNTALEIENAV